MIVQSGPITSFTDGVLADTFNVDVLRFFAFLPAILNPKFASETKVVVIREPYLVRRCLVVALSVDESVEASLTPMLLFSLCSV